ncbi:hypothetical protein GCM10020000_07070 [Streptomyces olivoverticillatus]
MGYRPPLARVHPDPKERRLMTDSAQHPNASSPADIWGDWPPTAPPVDEYWICEFCDAEKPLLPPACLRLLPHPPRCLTHTPGRRAAGASPKDT